MMQNPGLLSLLGGSGNAGQQLQPNLLGLAAGGAGGATDPLASLALL